MTHVTGRTIEAGQAEPETHVDIPATQVDPPETQIDGPETQLQDRQVESEDSGVSKYWFAYRVALCTGHISNIPSLTEPLYSSAMLL